MTRRAWVRPSFNERDGSCFRTCEQSLKNLSSIIDHVAGDMHRCRHDFLWTVEDIEGLLIWRRIDPIIEPLRTWRAARALRRAAAARDQVATAREARR